MQGQCESKRLNNSKLVDIQVGTSGKRARFGASPRAPAACGAFAEGACSRLPDSVCLSKTSRSSLQPSMHLQIQLICVVNMLFNITSLFERNKINMKMYKSCYGRRHMQFSVSHHFTVRSYLLTSSLLKDT